MIKPDGEDMAKLTAMGDGVAKQGGKGSKKAGYNRQPESYKRKKWKRNRLRRADNGFCKRNKGRKYRGNYRC